MKLANFAKVLSGLCLLTLACQAHAATVKCVTSGEAHQTTTYKLSSLSDGSLVAKVTSTGDNNDTQIVGYSKVGSIVKFDYPVSVSIDLSKLPSTVKGKQCGRSEYGGTFCLETKTVCKLN